VPARLDDPASLEQELGLGKLTKYYNNLWLAGLPLPPRPLHYQRLLDREIVVAERMDLHLIWTSGRIYMKPIPRFLLEPCFWSEYLACGHGPGCWQATESPCPSSTLWRCALGFLFSYAALICHESDFALALEKRLLPQGIQWADWRDFVRELDTKHIHSKIDVRFHYGELRLGRLNKLQLLASGTNYMSSWSRYGDFFSENFTWLASTTVYIAVVLTAMQVGLATTSLAENEAFQSASYGFTIFSILGPLAGSGLILAIFVHMFISNWRFADSFGKRRTAYIKTQNRQ
jgi:hypothetical protein